MVKKRYLIFTILILCIILSFQSVVYAGKWKEIDDKTSEYSECFETFSKAVNEAIISVSTWPFIQSVAKDITGDGFYDDDDIAAFGAGMEVGETRLYKYSNDSDGSYINSGGDLYEIYIKRQENITKGIFSKREVEQYQPIIKLVAENASVGTQTYAESYREFIARVNQELGTYIPLPKEDEELQDGDIVEFGNQRARNSKVYQVTVKARKVYDGALGIEYMGYTYNYIDVTSDETLKSPNTGEPTKPSDVIKTENLLDDLDDFKPGELGDETEFTKKVGVVLGVLNVIGAIISVITIMIIGFKYMIGSVEEKANYKKVMVPWFIGAILVFTVTTIPNILFNLGTSISEDDPVKTTQTQTNNNGKPNGDRPYFTQLEQY